MSVDKDAGFDDLERNRFNAAVVQIPHRSKVNKGGEDAFILTSQLLAVADGVGGWADKGVDPGIFARKLCYNVWERYQAYKLGTTAAVTALEAELQPKKGREENVNLTEVLVEAVD